VIPREWDSSDDDEWLTVDDSKRHLDWYETAEKEMGHLPK